MSFENELRDLFENDETMTITDGSVESVKQRAKQRTNRSRMAVGAAALALFVAGGAIVTTWDSQNAEEIETIDDERDEQRDGQVIDGDETIQSVGQMSAADFTYLGAFAVPPDDDAIVSADGGFEDPRRFGFGGYTAAFNPFGDPDGDDRFSGSIFLAGFPRNAQVAEISIPEPQPHSGSTTDLPVAEILQPFTDITSGRASDFIGSEEVGGLGEYRLGGLEVVDGPGGPRLHWTAWQWQDVSDHDNPGHGHSSLDFANLDPQGPWYLGDYEGYQTAGYLFSVPSFFADDALGGRTLISGFRDVESTSNSMSKGAPFFAFSPPETAPPETRISDPLALANYDHPNTSPDFNESELTPGATWVSTSDGRSAVVTVGNFNGLPSGDCTNDDNPLEFYGPKFTFYDPAGLAEVAQGSADAGQVAPYGQWNPSEHLIPTCALQIASISFDADAGVVYLVQVLADTRVSEFNYLPVVHVFEVA